MAGDRCRPSRELMQYDEIAALQAQHGAWTLLRAEHAPLILSFLGRVFVDGNAGARSASALIDDLDDELYVLNERHDPPAYPRSAAAYLDEWAAPEKGWLRKFYPVGSDEAHYDITPSVEKALLWVRDLRAREFVGTESRLNTLFELLRQMVYGADADPQSRLVELRRRRADLDDEIARAERGEVALLDDVGQRDRYQQFARNARELLADFREVEDNFRALDRRLRAQIAGWHGAKGELLDEVLSSRNSIAESDQGRSFRALYDFLLSHQRQSELSDLLDRLARIEAIEAPETRLRHVHFDWIDAGERTQGTVRLLSEQLRRFLDDQVWLENRRVFDLLRDVESRALTLRDERRVAVTMELDDTGVSLTLPFERPLYTPQRPVLLDSDDVRAGEADVDPTALLTQFYVDAEELGATVRRSLAGRDEVGLGEVVAGHPLRHGLAELIGYLSLAAEDLDVDFDASQREYVGWRADDADRVADLPTVTFSQTGGGR